VLRHPPGGDQHDVEADIALRIVGMMHEPKLGHDPAFAALRDGFDRCVVAPVGLDLDENQRTAAAAGGDISPRGVFQRRAAIR
jgi:hypothetical protein